MRVLALLLMFFFLVACAPPEKGFAVGIYNLTQETSMNSDSNGTSETLSFIVQNQESFALDCQVLLVATDSAGSVKKKGRLGILAPGESKPAAFPLDLASGDTNIDVTPVCVVPALDSS